MIEPSPGARGRKTVIENIKQIEERTGPIQAVPVQVIFHSEEEDSEREEDEWGGDDDGIEDYLHKLWCTLP